MAIVCNVIADAPKAAMDYLIYPDQHPANKALLSQPIPSNIGVYFITDTIGSSMYVGSTQHLNNRRRHHLNDLKRCNHYNERLQKLFNDNNGELLIYYQLLETLEDARYLEQQYIDRYYDSGHLCNIGKDVSASWLGQTHTEETKRKISERNKGNKYALGYKPSEETRQKISKARTGNSYGLGTLRSEETRRNMTISQRELNGVSIMVKDYINNCIVVYGSIAEAVESTGISRPTIRNLLKTSSVRIVEGYAFQRANVDTIQSWIPYNEFKVEE